MTNHRALSFSFLPAFAAALLFATPAAAQQTECQPDDLFCAEVRIGPGSAGIRIGGGSEQPPPPPVYQPPPQPPVVVVQPYQPPPPPMQPPTVVVQPYQPQQPVYQQQQVYQQQPVQRPEEDRYPASSLGVHLRVDGILGDGLEMMGTGAAFRIRPIPHLALDIGAGIYGGNDYNGMERYEVPVAVDALFFFNPQHRFQFYALLGVHGAFGHADGFNIHTGRYDSRDYFHLGGEVGLGLEWRLGRSFALNIDARGFIRQRVDNDPRPEFTEQTASGNWLATDTSGGFTAGAGMTIYFGN